VKEAHVPELNCCLELLLVTHDKTSTLLDLNDRLNKPENVVIAFILAFKGNGSILMNFRKKTFERDYICGFSSRVIYSPMDQTSTHC